MNGQNIRADWAWLDGLSEIASDERTATARRRFHANEWYFAHHFPALPVVPGVLLIEAMAHAAGILQTLRARVAFGEWYNHVLLAVQDAKFYRFVQAQQELVIEVELQSEVEESEVIGRCRAFVDGEKVARCRVTLHRFDTQPLEAPDAGGDPFGLMRYLQLIVPDDSKPRYGLC